MGGGLGEVVVLDNSREKVITDLEDRVFWKETKDGIFFFLFNLFMVL